MGGGMRREEKRRGENRGCGVDERGGEERRGEDRTKWQ